MEETNEIITADEQALIYDERLWSFLGNDVFSSVEEFVFVSNLHEMFKKLQKHERTIAPRYADAKQREQAAERCQKGYEVFNKLYKTYVAEEECEDETENYISEVKIPYTEIELLVESFVATSYRSRKKGNNEPFSFNEIEKDFKAIEDIEKALEEDAIDGYILTDKGIAKAVDHMMAMVEGNEFPKMALMTNGVRRDASELGLTEDEIEAAAELIRNR